MWQRLGYKVMTPKTLWGALKTLKRNTRLIIRIDGSGNLDPFTLIKIFVPTIEIYWEIHGSLEESEERGNHLSQAFKRARRFLLSFIPRGYIFISPTIQRFMAKRIAPKRSIVLPNFFVPSSSSPRRQDISSSIRKRHPSFIVFWGGDPRYRWQAIDLVDQIAATMYAVDPRVLFVIVGQGSWYKLKSRPNILLIPFVDEGTYWRVVQQSHVCLALYHRPDRIPFYFSPLKIITYLSAGKPVIATDIGEISQYISHKKNGFLTSNSTTQMVTYIQTLRNKLNLYKHMSEEAKQSSARFAIGSMSKVWKSRLSSFLSN